MPHLLEPIDPGKLLPHRFPFVLVDRISVAEPGRRVLGTKLVTAGEWSLVGSSGDGKSMLMPHLLIVEALAQVSAALFVSLLPSSRDVIGYFMALDRVRFRGHVVAGDELSLSVSLKQFRRGVCKTRGVARVGALQVVQAELTTVLRATSA
jgi:3-hydroxyacyl-[acyl-carrier-protein] dehydratase